MCRYVVSHIGIQTFQRTLKVISRLCKFAIFMQSAFSLSKLSETDNVDSVAVDLCRYILSCSSWHSIVCPRSPPDDWNVEIRERERGDVFILKGAFIAPITQKGTKQGDAPIAIRVKRLEGCWQGSREGQREKLCQREQEREIRDSLFQICLGSFYREYIDLTPVSPSHFKLGLIYTSSSSLSHLPHSVVQYLHLVLSVSLTWAGSNKADNTQVTGTANPVVVAKLVFDDVRCLFFFLKQ